MVLEWSLDFAVADPTLKAEDIHDVAALDGTLDRIGRAASQPLVVEMVSAGGARLGIGLGAPNSVLVFNGSPDPPYLISAGNLGSRDEDVAFYLHGHWTEFAGDSLISHAAAREAAHRFLASGDRPDNVKWEEV